MDNANLLKAVLALESKLTQAINQMNYTTREEIIATNFPTFDQYRDRNRSKDIVLVASGPTLRFYTELKPAEHIGVNSVAHWEQSDELDYYFVQDFSIGIAGIRERAMSMYDAVANKRCERFVGVSIVPATRCVYLPDSMIGQMNCRKYFTLPPIDASIEEITIHSDIRYNPLMDLHSVVFPAFHFALFTNPRRVYLVGCDASHLGKYYRDDDVPNVMVAIKQLEDDCILPRAWKRAKAFADLHYPQTEIISINPVGLKGLFKDEYTVSEEQIAELLAERQKN
jgi:hypothetical protein